LRLAAAIVVVIDYEYMERFALRFKRNIFFLGAFLVLTAVVTVALFGLMVPMGHGMDGNMVSCPLMGSPAAMCQMGLGEHVAAWRARFSVPIQFGMLFVLLVLVVFSLLRERPTTTDPPKRVWSVRHIFENSILVPFRVLQLAFADGVLNPKLSTRTISMR